MAKTAGRSSSTEVAVDELLQAMWQLLRRMRAEASGDQLTWSQTAVLAQLGRHGAMTTADLARAESVKPQSMGATLAALEQQGLVQRSAHPLDGRQVLFALTRTGIEMREKRARLKHRWVSTAFAKLDPSEQRALLDAVGTIKRLSSF